MMGHKISFNEDLWIIIPKLSLLPLLICSTAVFRIDSDPSAYLHRPEGDSSFCLHFLLGFPRRKRVAVV